MAGARDDIDLLESATEAVRKELQEENGTFKFPTTHLAEGQLLVESTREKTIAAAFSTISELESRRSGRSRSYFCLFGLGSLALILGKLGNWLHERAERASRSDLCLYLTSL